MDEPSGLAPLPPVSARSTRPPQAAAVRAMLTWHIQPLRLVVVALAILAYLAVDGVMLARHETHIHWAMSVNPRGTITWVDPNGPAANANLHVGDKVLAPAGVTNVTEALLDELPALQVRHLGTVRTVTAAPVFGSTTEGQLLVLMALPMLLIGGFTWAAGGRRTPPALLGLLSAAIALSLLAEPWGRDGIGWAMRVVEVAAGVVTPLVWAALFLAFPYNRYRSWPWRLSFLALCALGLATAIVVVLRLFIGLPPVVEQPVTDLILPLGVLLGLTGLCLRTPGETPTIRQQRRIIALSAACAILPFLLLSFVPDVVQGQPIIPFEVAAFAFLMLPLGFAYAMARYDLMELDMVVRQLAAQVVATVVLLVITLFLSLGLSAALPQEAVILVAVCLVVGARSAVGNTTRAVVERLLSPELARSRALLTTIDSATLRGDTDLPALARELETSVQVVSRVSRCRFLARRFPSATFAAPRAAAPVVTAMALTEALRLHPWGLAAPEMSAPDEWNLLATTLIIPVPLTATADEHAMEPTAVGVHCHDTAVSGRPQSEAHCDTDLALIMPVVMRGEVIGLVLLGARHGDEPLRGPDREALAFLIEQFAPALDYARVRADLEARLAEATAFSAASAGITAALGDRDALVTTIVESLAAQPDVRDVALLLAGSGAIPEVVAARGSIADVDLAQQLPAQAAFSLSPQPIARLPLQAGATPIGMLYVRWHAGAAVDQHQRQFLTMFAHNVAMALEQARLYNQARIHAERDSVTDLYNHRAFHARLEQALVEAWKTGGHVGVLLIDLVNFKLFNDTYGHQAGDRALQQVGEILRGCCKREQLAARLGGDEFALLLPGADRDAASIMAERVTALAAQAALLVPEGIQVPIRLSIGAGSFPQDAEAINTLLARVDERMYEAKRAGVPLSLGEQRLPEADAGRKHFGVLESLVAMVDNRDRYTAEHSEQVADYACTLGAALGLSHHTIDTLRIAGLLHDVGKIGVPDRILRKPGRLSDEEMEIVRRHVELSEALVTTLTKDHDLIDAVAYHHERWDGKGYPRRAAGEGVPLLGRIMIIADAVSAMAMDRPYRKGLSWNTIAAELAKGAGSQFDPALVPMALSALRPLIKEELMALA